MHKKIKSLALAGLLSVNALSSPISILAEESLAESVLAEVVSKDGVGESVEEVESNKKLPTEAISEEIEVKPKESRLVNQGGSGSRYDPFTLKVETEEGLNYVFDVLNDTSRYTGYYRLKDPANNNGTITYELHLLDVGGMVTYLNINVESSNTNIVNAMNSVPELIEIVDTKQGDGTESAPHKLIVNEEGGVTLLIEWLWVKDYNLYRTGDVIEENGVKIYRMCAVLNSTTRTKNVIYIDLKVENDKKDIIDYIEAVPVNNNIPPSNNEWSTITTKDELDRDWDYTDNGSTIILGGYKGASQKVEIPRVVDGKQIELSNFNQSMFQNVTDIRFANGINKVKIKSGSLRQAFLDDTDLQSIDLNGLDTSSVTSMHEMFRGCSSLVIVSGLETLDTALVTNLQNMFYECVKLEGDLNLSSWDTSRVTTMQHMFYRCGKLGSIDFGNMESGSLEDIMGQDIKGVLGMFKECTNLKTVTMRGLSPKNPVSMYEMFRDCRSLTTINGIDTWDTSTVIDMNNMFRDCTNLSGTLDLSRWITSEVTNMQEMFRGCNALVTINGLDAWDTINVTTMQNMFYECTSLSGDLNLTAWNTSKVTSMQHMFYKCKALSSVDFGNMEADGLEDIANQDIKGISGMFKECANLKTVTMNNLNTVNSIGMQEMFRECKSLTTISGINTWNTININNMDNMFRDCIKLGATLDLSQWNTSNVTSMYEMFRECTSLTTINGIEGWDTSKVANMENMLYRCISLGATLNLSQWNTSEVTSTQHMFYECKSLTSVDLSGLDLRKVNNMAGMFKECRFLTKVKGIETLNVKNVTTMSEMFYGCSSLTELTINNINTSSLTSIYRMFFECTKLTRLNITNWNVPQLTNTGQLFFRCGKLSVIDMSNFAADSLNDMAGQFTGLGGLTEVDLTGCSFPEATNMSRLFAGCPKLTTVRGDLDLPKVDDLSQMFSGCTSLTDVNLNSWNVESATNMSNIFDGCKVLDKLDLSNWNTPNVTNFQHMFKDTNNLRYLDIRNFTINSNSNNSEMFKIANGGSTKPLLVITTDSTLAGYDYKNDKRNGCKIKFNSSDGFFDEATGDKTKYGEEIFAINISGVQSLDDIVLSLVLDSLNRSDVPTRTNYLFDKWKLNRATNYSQDEVERAFEALNDEYIATWTEDMIRVTVPINTLPVQLTTNLKNQSADPFTSGTLTIQNSSTTRPLKVSIAEFTDNNVGLPSGTDKLQLLDPNEVDANGNLKYDDAYWDSITGKDSYTKMAIGMYAIEGINGRTPYVKEDPLWLVPNKVNKIEIGTIPPAESDTKPREAKIGFTSKHALPRNFMDGKAKSQYKLVLLFE